VARGALHHCCGLAALTSVGVLYPGYRGSSVTVSDRSTGWARWNMSHPEISESTKFNTVVCTVDPPLVTVQNIWIRPRSLKW
jgi:hypothetical protein